MMDCDTTGIEPDIALVKYKSLAGGGMLKIVNNTVPEALSRLGYDDEQRKVIVDYINDKETIEGAPGLRPEHLPVFDTSFLAEGGTRCLSWKAHVGMMAAAQPFISGAISKCVRGDSLLTTKQGLVRIGILHRGEKEDTFRPEALRVASLGGLKTTDAFYYGGTRPTIGVTLRSGHRVVATHVHPLLVCRGGKLEWKKTADIVAGDYVATQYGSDLWPERQFQVTGFSYKRLTASKDVTLPSEVTADFGFLLGSFAADGNYTEVNGTVTITKGEQAVRDKVVECWRNVFGIEAVHYLPSDRCAAVKASSKEVVAFLKHLGVETGSANKRIPDCILQSPKPVVLAFLQGLFQDSYIHNGNSGKWGICVASPGLIDDLSAVLTNLGIVHGHAEKWNKEYERYYHELYVTGDHAKLLFSLVPFNEEHKKAAARIFLDNSYSCNTADVIPGLKGRELHALLPSRRSRKAVGASRSSFSALLDDRTKSVSRRSLERIASAPGVVLPRDLRIILDNNLHFSPVVKVEDTGECEVYDVSVPDTHAFVANGIVNHNTINFPKDATRAQIKEAIVEAWHKKLKAVAMYRDGSKWSQPLSTSSTDSREATIPFGQRRKLPKTREAFTHHFRVGGHDGYVTPGMYKDGTPGEIFIKMNKEGSTVAGLMDTIAILTSISLQHGVPLELLVDKLSYMDFEPRGLTDNPQVPTARSVVDYIFRWLGQRFNPKTPEDDDGAVELYPTEAAKASQAKAGWEVVVTRSYVKTDKVAATPGDTVTGPPCPCCGSMTIRTGPCFSCRSCGNTTGGCG
jgi:intein/homing endonuclease